MAKTVVLADIAEKAGVSAVTVSKALSGQKGVSEVMRQKIISLADEMGYRRSVAAVKQKIPVESYNIGVLIHEMYLGKYNSFYLSMYQFIAACAIDRGSFALMEAVSHDMVAGFSLPKMIQEKKVDGLIVLGCIKDSYLLYLKENVKVPMVFLDFIGQELDADYVVSDGFYGGYYMTKYLLSKGHRDIAYVGTVGATNSITSRYLGYQMALLENGQNIREDWQLDDRNKETGVIDEALMKLPEEMPTAFFCNCDLTAASLIHVLENAGYSVPEDISVAGYDNYLMPGICEIGITSYEIDMKGMTEKALDVLGKKLRKENMRSGINVVVGRLVEKESVKAL